MGDRYRVTHTLLSSWLYTMYENPYEQNADDDGDAKKPTKMDEFMLTLNRIGIPDNEAMQNGRNFEDLVTNILLGVGDVSHKWYTSAEKIAETIKGSKLQYEAFKSVEIAGTPMLLHGKFDALHAGVIYDIKFSKSYAVGKYINSTQHPMYMELCPAATEFTYLICNGSNVFRETYRRDETPSIYPIIEQFLTWLDIHLLDGIYREKWVAKC